MSDEEAMDFYTDAKPYEQIQLGHILGEAIMGTIKHDADPAEDLCDFRDIIAEESGEVLDAIGMHRACLMHGTQDKDHLRRELHQLAAACLALLADLDGQRLAPEPSYVGQADLEGNDEP